MLSPHFFHVLSCAPGGGAGRRRCAGGHAGLREAVAAGAREVLLDDRGSGGAAGRSLQCEPREVFATPLVSTLLFCFRCEPALDMKAAVLLVGGGCCCAFRREPGMVSGSVIRMAWRITCCHGS